MSDQLGDVVDVECDALILLLGFHSHLGSIADWGLEDGYFASTEDGERFYRELAWLYAPARARIATCVGGMDAVNQVFAAPAALPTMDEVRDPDRYLARSG